MNEFRNCRHSLGGVSGVGIKIAASLAFVVLTTILGHIAWQELFQRADLGLDYARALIAGPHYLVQCWVVSAALLVGVMVGDRLTSRGREGFSRRWWAA